MKINDIFGAGKVLPSEKLLELVEKIFGRLTKKKFDKIDADSERYKQERLADAEAYKIKIVGEAKQEVEIKGKLAEAEFLERTKQRLLKQEMQKQFNTENVLALTKDNLANEEAVKNNDVNQDWANRFFSIISEISDEEVQKIWAKILTEEIKKPNSYSLRTLDVLRNLSKQEATVFLRAAKLKIKENGNFFILNDGISNFLNSYDLNFKDISLLEEVGLLETGRFTTLDMPDDVTHFKVGNFILVAEKKENHKYSVPPSLPIKMFTRVGTELLNLVADNPDFRYIKIIEHNIITQSMTVKYAKYDDKKGGMNYQDNLELIPK